MGSMIMSARRYYSVRAGKKPHLDLPNLLGLFFALYSDLDAKGCFQEAFGYYCVDQGDVPGTSGADYESYWFRKLRKSNLWPVESRYQEYTEDDLFDVIEFLYDHISMPVKGRFHSYGNCGWHYETFDQLEGREEYRAEINNFLVDYGEGFELSEDGEIVILGLPGTESLLEAPLPPYDEQNIESRVQTAIDKYRRSRSSLASRRDAVRDLGDVLEFVRPKAKEVLSSKDESDLFNILNNFGIRHHNEKQKTDYDEAIYLSWLFYHYLAAIHACVRLIQQRARNAGA